MRQTLLLTEGDPELCDSYERYLTRHGYEVETAAHGLDCLEKLRRKPPAVLVLDWELRWGGGDGVLAWLREEHAAFEVPVVLMSTAGSSPALCDLRPPVVQFLPKPFALAALLQSVRAAARWGREFPLHLDGAVRPDLFIG
jgi:DNA-binding response OmpR family regulator